MQRIHGQTYALIRDPWLPSLSVWHASFLPFPFYPLVTDWMIALLPSKRSLAEDGGVES